MVNNMNFVNVQIPTGYILDPTLNEMVGKLALRNPTHTYSAKGMDDSAKQNWSSTRPRGKSSADRLEDGRRYLHKLNVHCGPELLGSIHLDMRYGRPNGSELVYCISSWRIHNERGSQNVTKTAKLDSALRLAKTAFVPQNVNELMDKAESTTIDAFKIAVNDLKRPVTHSLYVQGTINMQRYLFAHFTNRDIPADAKSELEKSFTSEKYVNAMAEYELAKHMYGQQMQVVVAHNGGYLMRADRENGEVYIKHYSFDELPEKAQNNIAVLQLMEDGELVYDVGFRYDSNCFLILQ